MACVLTLPAGCQRSSSEGETPPSFLLKPKTRVRYGGKGYLPQPGPILTPTSWWRGENLALTGVAASSASLGDRDSQEGLELQSPIERKLWQTVFFLNNFHPCVSVIGMSSSFVLKWTCGELLRVLICCSPSDVSCFASFALGYL